jgi:hypothetical protein
MTKAVSNGLVNQKHESMVLAGIQVLVLFVCLAGIVWDLAIGLIFNLDGLLLLLICLSLSAVFGLSLFLQARKEGWLQRSRPPGPDQSASEVSALAPASKSAPSGKQK